MCFSEGLSLRGDFYKRFSCPHWKCSPITPNYIQLQPITHPEMAPITLFHYVVVGATDRIIRQPGQDCYGSNVQRTYKD